MDFDFPLSDADLGLLRNLVSEDFAKHKNMDCIYYDLDMKELRKAFTLASDVFKRISKRCERAETQRISKSVFDFVRTADKCLTHPEILYNFRSYDIKVSLCRGVSDCAGTDVSSEYYVKCEGFTPDCCFDCPRQTVDGRFGFYDTLEPCLDLFHRCVAFVCKLQIGELFV